jgi:hypothetical protein
MARGCVARAEAIAANLLRAISISASDASDEIKLEFVPASSYSLCKAVPVKTAPQPGIHRSAALLLSLMACCALGGFASLYAQDATPAQAPAAAADSSASDIPDSPDATLAAQPTATAANPTENAIAPVASTPPGITPTSQPGLNGLALLAPARPGTDPSLVPWDRSAAGRFKPGSRGPQISATGGHLTDTASLFQPSGTPNALSGLRGAGINGPPLLSMQKLNQLNSQQMNLRFNSSAGSFRFTYREVFGARANSVGGGVGQGTAAATFSSTNFGGSLFNFSAAALMGAPAPGSVTGGFQNSPTVFTGGTQKHPAPTVALRLTF